MDAQLSYIKLSHIVLSPTNPRKFFDQTKINELADSIKEKGVIQPVLLRKKGDKYELVFGERRYRASRQAGRQDIPSVIRELDDQEVRELQLIENFQRVDPHPMEEAVAIHAATATGQYTLEDLAHKVGKPKKCIAQRLKLMDLVEPLQTIFFENKINISAAMKLATISKIDQERYIVKTKTNPDYYYSTQQVEYYIKQCQGNLNKAVFSLEDPTLSPEFGPCTTCPFNSRNQNLLFPDGTKDHVCMNHQDYEKKTEAHYERASKEALQDPAIVLINNSYNTSIPEAESLKKGGHIVLKKYDDFELVKEPQKEEIDKGEYENESEYQDAMIEANGAFEKEKLAFEKKQSTGKLVKAFVVSGEDKGATVFVELKKKAEQKVAASSVASGHAGLTDIENEITRLNELEARKKELDAEKVHVVVKEIILKDPAFRIKTEALSRVEEIAITVAMWEGGSYSFQERISKLYGFKRHLTGINLYNYLVLASTDLPLLMRHLMIDKLADAISARTSAPGQALHQVANEYFPTEVKKAMDDQQAIADKSIQRVNTRIEELDQQKQGLQKEQKQPKKNRKQVLADQ